VQRRLRRRTGPGDVPGVRRDQRLDECDVQPQD
jgi:hypothetical protein